MRVILEDLGLSGKKINKIKYLLDNISCKHDNCWSCANRKLTFVLAKL